MEDVLKEYRRIALTEYMKLVEKKRELERYKESVLRTIACGDAVVMSMLFLWLANNLDVNEEVKRRALIDMSLELLIIDLKNR